MVNENVESLTQFINIYPMSKNKLFWMPREDDIVMTDPSKKGEQQSLSFIKKIFCVIV